MKNNKNNSLKHLMNEVMSEKNITKRINGVNKKVLFMDENAINSLIGSKVFTLDEQTAMRILFSKTKTKSLTENTINELDKNVQFIVNSNEMEIRLKEGFFGDIWDGLKTMGNKAKEAIVGGWSKLKAIWAEFKELVQEVINSAKNGLVKLCNMTKTASVADAQNMVKDLVSKGKLKVDDDFKKEILQLKESSSWWVNDWYQKWIVKPFWEKDVLSGKGNIEEEPKIDAKEAEKGLETIPALEGLIRKRNSLLSNYDVVTELLKRNEKRNSLKEAHSVEHLDDAIKNPALRKVVHYAVELIQWAFIPFAKLGQIIGKWAGPKLLSSFSNTTKTFGGPGTYAFELLGTLFGELLEVVVKKMASKYATGIVKDIMFPGFGLSENVVDAIHNALLVWTIANILINLVDSVEKEGGSTEESFKSSGKFKIQDGNLLYLK
jgi:hypothetical protein